ncbi:MAG: bifunctional 4-hydroxy-2-oxoglutarate aldolase/2-dehydro-3-deoxy-phosphogluconate aldolase [Anaerolineae bacterium]|nr:bifunctional 4-hydroxy-2-oxoglutarate aldolase/2-dehydro-3-deoxy-phosphogluconate aldolase [Anaerolineae bacterium]
MSRFTRMQVLNTMYDTGLLPIFYHGDLTVSKEVIKACVAGGARIIEFTNRGDRAWNVFTALISFLEQEAPDVIMGIGSVIDAPTAAMYIASGANFIVSPVLVSETARVCNRHKVAYLPGCGTLGEISQAEELGCEIVKIFPGDCVGGPEFIRAIKGPMPWTSLLPTGGVSMDNAQEWIKAGAACLGMGSQLIRKDWVKTGDYARIGENVAAVLELIQEARG